MNAKAVPDIILYNGRITTLTLKSRGNQSGHQRWSDPGGG